MSEDMQEVKLMVRDIHTAMFGPDSHPQEGVLTITRANQREIATLKTQAKTIWAVFLAIPLLGGVLAMLGYMPEMAERSEILK